MTMTVGAPRKSVISTPAASAIAPMLGPCNEVVSASMPAVTDIDASRIAVPYATRRVWRWRTRMPW